MTRFRLLALAALLLTVTFATRTPAAEQKGQPDLDKATQLKLNAKSTSDLGDIIELCESALAKGLDPANVPFAKSMLAATLVQRGTIRAESGRLDASLEDLDKAIEMDPQNPAGYEIKGAVLAKQKQYDEALAVLEKGRKMAPEAVSFPVQKARVYSAQGNRKAALEELNKAAAMEPENLGVLLLRSAIYQEMNEKQKALADMTQVLKLKPDLSMILRGRAMLLSELGKYDEAVADLEKLRKAAPKDPVTLLQLGMLYTAQKKNEKAIEALDALLADYPGEWIAYRARGDVKLNVGRRREAITDYDRAMQIQPKDAALLNNLSWVLATAPEEKLRDGKRAAVLANEACKLTAYKLPHILSTLAAAYAETGDFQEAVKWAEKAIEIGSKEHGEELKKELESYKAGKPWREAQPVQIEAQKPEEKK